MVYLIGTVFLSGADAPATSHPTTLEIWLGVAAMLSAVGAIVTMVIGVLMTKGRWKIDRGTIEKMDRERQKEEEERDATRKKEDEDRNRKRIEDDERRADGLRTEMATLVERNASQFEVILDLRDEIAELRQWVAGTHRIWDNEAVTEITRLGGHLRPPPDLPPHRRKKSNNHA